MNIPFKLALAAATPYGVLWNPWGSTVPTSVNNTILTNLASDVQIALNLYPPKNQVWVTSFSVVSDTAGAKVSLGLYSVSLATFYEIYPVDATFIAGGGIVRPFIQGESGIFLPVSSDMIPVFKLIAGTAAEITGDIGFMPIPDAAVPTDWPVTIPSEVIQDELGASILDETGNTLRNE